MHGQERYLTVAEYVKITGYSRATVSAWCRKGILRAEQPAGPKGAWRIHPSELKTAKEKDLPAA